MMKKLIITLLLMIQIALCWPLYAQAGTISGLRGQRYCEILLGKPRLTGIQFQVYNTIGLNNCPLAQWQKITLQQLKEQTGMSKIHLNPPRYWVIDGMQQSNFQNPTVRVLGGIPMRQVAILQIPWRTFLRHQQPYQTHTVHRHTTWVYNAGKPIYELVDSQGRVFIMQAYSAQQTPQTPVSLSHLATTLHLPEGWSFRSRVLKKNAYLTPVNQNAVVVQDDLFNTYQQETPDFSAE